VDSVTMSVPTWCGVCNSWWSWRSVADQKISVFVELSWRRIERIRSVTSDDLTSIHVQYNLPAFGSGNLSSLILFGILRNGRSWNSSAATGFLFDHWNHPIIVSVLPVKPTTTQASWVFLSIFILHCVWWTSGFRPLCHTNYSFCIVATCCIS